MPTPLLPQETLDEIRTAVLTIPILGYDPMTRNALLSGLPANLRGILPGGMAAPAIGLTLDLAALNNIERLGDGSVPLKRFLENAIQLGGMIEAADVLRRALADVEIGTSGARPPSTPPLEQQEAIIARDDMVPFGFLAGGITAAHAVAKLMVPRHENGLQVAANGKPVIYLGTGWLIAEGLLMTNHHVVNARSQGEAPASEADLRLQVGAMTVLFDYDDDTSAGAPATVEEALAWDPELDYALVRLRGTARVPLTPVTVAVTDVSPASAMAVNVIQHPDGRSKRFAIRNNLVTAATPTELRYFTDTLGGSSGSPVLNDTWQVVALHRGSAFVRGVKFQGREVAYVNVGTQITAVMQHLRQQQQGKIPELGI